VSEHLTVHDNRIFKEEFLRVFTRKCAVSVIMSNCAEQLVSDVGELLKFTIVAENHNDVPAVADESLLLD
jgi:hypothetical protein